MQFQKKTEKRLRTRANLFHVKTKCFFLCIKRRPGVFSSKKICYHMMQFCFESLNVVVTSGYLRIKVTVIEGKHALMKNYLEKLKKFAI